MEEINEGRNAKLQLSMAGADWFGSAQELGTALAQGTVSSVPAGMCVAGV